MPAIISCISNKGGVGKSTLSRLIATGYARDGHSVLLADLDTRHTSSLRWHERRIRRNVKPIFPVAAFRNVKAALDKTEDFDFIVVDENSTNVRRLRDTAAISNLVLIPLSLSVDDMEPTFDFMDDLRDHMSTWWLRTKLRTKGSGKRHRTTRKVPFRHGHLCLSRVIGDPSKISDGQLQRMLVDYNLVKGYLPEKLAYQNASNAGRAANETISHSLNARANRVFDEVKNLLELEVTGYSAKAFNRIDPDIWLK